MGIDTRFPAINVESSRGSFVYDKRGRRYIDFSTNWCAILGWGLPVVEKAIKQFRGPNYVDPYYHYQPWEELSKLLISIAPGQMTSAFKATSGTEAVEIALQAAMNYTKRYEFISDGGYHGHSFAAMSVGFPHYRERFPNLIPSLIVDPPYNKARATKIVKFLSTHRIAAFITEPIIFNRGVLEPTQEYFNIIQKSCQKYGTVFIVDEVATGFGRTGKMFASEYYDLKPDVICLGKGLTGGNAVLGACLMNRKLTESMQYEFSYYSTFAWQPLNVQITLAYLNYFLQNSTSILKKVNSLSCFIRRKLGDLESTYGVKVRMKGLAIALHLENGNAERIRNICIKKHLLIDCLNPHTLTLFPSISMKISTLDYGLNILISSVRGSSL